MPGRWHVLDDCPAGTVSAQQFAVRHGVPELAFRLHIDVGIKGECVEAVKLHRGSLVWRYLTPEQQQKAFEFWDRHGVRYRKRDGQ